MAIDCPTYKSEIVYIDKGYQYGDFVDKKEKKNKSTYFDFVDIISTDLDSFIGFEANKKSINYIFDQYKLEINMELSYLEKTFIDSEYIVQLEDNWDDEGAIKYDILTWFKAINFVNEYANILFLDFNKKIIQPKIYHGPIGSIDVLFETKNYTLLINILNGGDIAEYFGKDKSNNTVKGTFSVDKINKSLIPLAFDF